jgi:Tol biopolymer transport system component
MRETTIHHEALLSSMLVISLMLLSSNPAFAADPGNNGKIAFFANLTGVSQIYTVNPDGTGLFQVTNVPPAIDPSFALAPDFSPDGKRIVFPHDMTGALELYVINADGTGLTQITHDGRLHAVPHWSPDGRHIIFATPGDLGPAVIATVASDGSDFAVLTTPVWDSLGQEYTADGKHIVFVSQLGGFVAALWMMDTNGKHLKLLSAPELETGAPDVSPDGKQVVFYNHQNTPQPTSIFKMNLDGTGVAHLTSAGHMDTLPVFSPDGAKILYMSDRQAPGSFDTWIMDADGSHKKLLIKGAFAPNWGVQPAN